MLGAGRYLLGVVEIGLLVGFASLGGATLKCWLLPRFEGPPAFLATAVLSISLLLLVAEVLGSFSLFEPLPYLLVVTSTGLLLRFSRGWRGGRGAENGGRPAPVRRPPSPRGRTRGREVDPATLAALAISAVAVIHFGLETKTKLGTGMTGFDSTWYHGPFAAGFFQSGDTWGLHFIAPQFLAWFYPANSEVVHAIGMLAFSRDTLSPLLNLGWFVGCLVAAWCVGRPYRVGAWSLALAAIALSMPALSDQAGEARNDIVGIFFLLAAVAISVNARAVREDDGRLPLGAVAVVGLAVGLAAGTKLNFLLPGAALVIGLAVIAGGARWKTLGAGVAGALLGGGYWYLRNLAHAGNPLPWVKHLGPVTLPAPEQALGGREGHSVFGYLTDGSVWSDWFLPGLHHGLTLFWPLLAALACAGLVLALGRRSDPALRVVAAAGLAAALAWLVAPTSASGPDGMPHGFESGLRYLTPSLILGLSLLPAAPPLRVHLTPLRLTSPFVLHMDYKRRSQRWGWLIAVAFVLVVVGLGYPVQRRYLQSRYADPSFSTPGLNAAFRWARDLSDARIATTSTRQYPLFGTDLSNHVAYVGEERPHGGFTAPTTCRHWRELIDAGHYGYVVATRDRLEPNKPPYPPTAAWTAGPGAKVILRKPPTVVYKLTAPLSVASC